jgi:hypothetical protein
VQRQAEGLKVEAEERAVKAERALEEEQRRGKKLEEDLITAHQVRSCHGAKGDPGGGLLMPTVRIVCCL